MVAELVVWHGDTAQVRALLEAIERNCTCKTSRGACVAHQALLDQRFCDGLLFARWMRTRLLSEELA